LIDETAGGIRDNVLYRSGAPSRVEFEANRLAADLVMPPALIDEEIRKIEGQLSEPELEALARRFGVSKAAMEIRVSGR
jgi:Zn-dependent peptidase ImmA (M78 family)